MKTQNRIIILGGSASILIAALSLFASQVLAPEGAAGIYSVIGLLLVAALDKSPRSR